MTIHVNRVVITTNMKLSMVRVDISNYFFGGKNGESITAPLNEKGNESYLIYVQSAMYT